MKIFEIFRQPKLATRLFVIGAIAVIAIIIIGLALVFSQQANTNLVEQELESRRYYLNEEFKDIDPYVTTNPNLDDILAGPIITSLDPSQGSDEAKVVLVIYSDFECDYCEKQEQVLKQALDEYGDDLRLIWKDYPISAPTTPSYQAAVAGRCAFAQGKFWEYHDLLYDFSKDLTKDTFLKVADMLKLDKSDFEKCLGSDAPEKQINDNIEEANALDITGIPFVYINDQEIMGEVKMETLKKIIDIELNVE